MSGKNQYPTIFNWQASDPRIGFLPNNTQSGSIPSGVTSGVMTALNTIYSNIMNVAKMDNLGATVSWVGTPTGVLTVYASSDGINFPSMTFSPALAQPAGASGYYNINFTQLGFTWIMIAYTNGAGAGTLTISSQQKDLN